MYKLSNRSKDNLVGIHPDLIKIVNRALITSLMDFTVIEGLRTKERQALLFAEKKTQTMDSRHLYGLAIDVVPLSNGQLSWYWPHFHVLAKAFKEAAKDENIPIEWGGDWTTFKDGPHWQLPKKSYSNEWQK